MLRKPFLLKLIKFKEQKHSVLALNVFRSELTSGKIYCPPNLVGFDNMCGAVVPGEWRKSEPSGTWLGLEPSTSRDSVKEAKDVREEFV